MYVHRQRKHCSTKHFITLTVIVIVLTSVIGNCSCLFNLQKYRQIAEAIRYQISTPVNVSKRVTVSLVSDNVTVPVTEELMLNVTTSSPVTTIKTTTEETTTVLTRVTTASRPVKKQVKKKLPTEKSPKDKSSERKIQRKNSRIEKITDEDTSASFVSNSTSNLTYTGKLTERIDNGNSLSHYSPVPPQLSSRPFYNIAHMVNSIKEINYYLSRGANAIEADVAFSPNGSALYTFHGYPCDCFRHCTEREDITKYLEYVREITRPESPYYKRSLALLFLDLKISNLPPSAKAFAGQDMAAKIIEHVFQGGSNVDSKINILLSIGHIYDSDFILGFQNEIESRDLTNNLSSRIGWDVGLNDPVNTILSMWRRIEVINNIWQGDGRSNCISPFYNLGRLTQVVARRDERNDMLDDIYIDKVYHWTIDLTHNLRASLRTGVDGIITNHPERLTNILREVEFTSKFRLADQSDSPWERIQSRVDFNPSPAAPITQPVSARWASGVGDMVTSFAKYLRDFVFLRVPSYHNISY